MSILLLMLSGTQEEDRRRQPSDPRWTSASSGKRPCLPLSVVSRAVRLKSKVEPGAVLKQHAYLHAVTAASDDYDGSHEADDLEVIG